MVIDFSSFYNGSGELERIIGGMLRTAASPRRRSCPLVNIAEDEGGYIVDVCIPGVAPEDIELTITARNLIIKGERKSPEGHYFRQERIAGVFQRTLNFNVPVDHYKVTATSKNGILRVVLPKAEAVKPRKIGITS